MIVTDDKASIEDINDENESIDDDKEQREEETNIIEDDDESIDKTNDDDDGQSTNEDETNNDSDNKHEDIDYTNGHPKRSNAGTGIDRLEMTFGGKSYKSHKAKQFIQKHLFKQKTRKKQQYLQATSEMKKTHSSEDDFKHRYLRKAINVIFAQVEEDGTRYQ
eukprot:11906568-Ditylum_brightwellii.AAC.1